MPLTARLALIGAAIVTAAALAFAVPLPAELQHSHDDRPYLTTGTTPTGVCGCGSTDRHSEHA